MELVKMTTRIPKSLRQQLQDEANSRDIYLQDLVAAKLSVGLVDSDSVILDLLAIREFMTFFHSLKAPAFDLANETGKGGFILAGANPTQLTILS